MLTDIKQRWVWPVVSVCFFLSGTSGLIYQVLWTRMSGLLFGHTVFAITTVLSAFMAGLGLGSYLFGKRIDGQGRPLVVYGFLEIGIGLYAFLTPSLFSWVEFLFIEVYRGLGISFVAVTGLQFVLSFLILIVPTLFMGATLPVFCRFVVRKMEAFGTDLARIYALNTFGAVLGAFAAGFYLIPILGVHRTLYLAALINLAVGLAAVSVDCYLNWGEKRDKQPQIDPLPFAGENSLATSEPDAGPTTGVYQLLVLGLALSGAVAMIYEIAWTRALTLVIGSSTYAFSTMLVTFLIGLALGSHLFSRYAREHKARPVMFGILQLGIGLSALAAIACFDRLPDLFVHFFRYPWIRTHLTGFQFLLSALVMFLPTLFMGATFPCVAQIASRSINRVGHDVGSLYLINAGGAIVGTIFGGLFLIPVIGLQSTMKIAVTLNLGLSLVVFLASIRRTVAKGALAAGHAAALAFLYVSPAWNPHAMASGVAVYARIYAQSLNETVSRQNPLSLEKILFYRDGISSTVTVHRRGDSTFLRINGKTDASNKVDMHTQRMTGHLPVILHRDAPQRALVIGFGSGVTSAAIALHPLAHLDIVEIEPAVAEAAIFFARENREVLNDPRVRLTIGDGRTFLLAQQSAYDVIVSEPSNPWIRGMGNLFSLEFYNLVAGRLAPNGIMCQWVQVYNITPEDLKMVVRTFRSVFPHATIWGTTEADFLLIGSKNPFVLDFSRVESMYKHNTAFRADMEATGFHSALAFLADFVLSEKDTKRYVQGGGRLNTDDHPLLEFSTPRSLYRDTVQMNQKIIKKSKDEEFPPVVGLPTAYFDAADFRRNLGLAFLAKEIEPQALAQFSEAITADPRDTRSLLERGKLYARLGSLGHAEADFRMALKFDPSMTEAQEALSHLVWKGLIP